MRIMVLFLNSHRFFYLVFPLSLATIKIAVVMIMIPHETGCELLEIVQSEGYNENCFRNDLKLLFTQIGVYNKRTVVLFSIINDQVSQSNSVEIFFVLVFFSSLNCWIKSVLKN